MKIKRRSTSLIVLLILSASSGIFANNGAKGQGNTETNVNLTAFCPIANFFVSNAPSLYPTVLAVSHNITNTNMILKKNDIIRFSILLNTNLVLPVCNIGNIALNLTVQLSNNSTFTGSYKIKDNDYQLSTPIIGSVIYLGSNSQLTASKRVNVDARIPPPPFHITSICHTSDPDIQFTPDTLMEVVMNLSNKATNGRAYFSIPGMTNVSFITMQNISSNILRGTYLVKESDFIENGTLRGYVISPILGVLKTNVFNRSNYINIGPVIKKQNNAQRRIVIQSIDVAGQDIDEKDTILELPKGSLQADSQIRIDPVSFLTYNYSTKTVSGKSICSLPQGSRINIRYHVHNNVVDGLNVPADKVKGNLGLFYDDCAHHWQLISKDVTALKMVVTGSGQFSGVYAVKADDQSTRIVIAPNPFTPGNQDGVNDSVIFHIRNDNQENVRALIFTLSGRKVCEIPPEKIIQNGTISLAEWDGRKDTRLVDGGLYIVKIQIGGSWYTATVVLAK